ncbi:uncharacterized protein [Mycetomoellerius zeteki]|uniref:uncharacterized protein n=1 Tax=Mycetomoellerius zeteki TaxID=64791 RepID=UPI00084E7AF1|nr:PREDICTED: uncharacterized protein LOC108720937 [Trachymyrmex zeteki]
MADRTKLLVQKRTSLKSQITNLANLLDKGKIDGKNLKLRITRLTELYRAFEEYNDELAVLDPSDVHHSEFSNIQERFYALAVNAENKLGAANMANKGDNISSDEIRIENTETATTFRKRRIKLPEAPLLTFDGKFENWLSFKNAFSSMIGAQTDLTDVDKLYYLKSALTGEAGNKIKIFSIDGASYTKAWDLLERSYEVKRILIMRHLATMVNLPTVEKENTNGLTKLADDAQQHIAALTLGVTIGQEMIVYLIESKLPKATLDKWQATLVRDTFPKLEDLYEFVYKTAVCASIRERPISTETNKSKYEPPVKKRKFDAPNRALVVRASRNCIACKGKRHPLYTCNVFKQLTVTERIDMVKKAKLCYNCLRSHYAVQIFKLYDRSAPSPVALTIPYVTPQLMTSALIYVCNSERNTHVGIECRALLDTCATTNFITESIVKRLGVRTIKKSSTISAINAVNTVSKGVVKIAVQSLDKGFCKTITCLTIPTITDLVPSEIFPRGLLALPSDIKLADPEFHLPRPVEMLIGSGATLSLFSDGQIDLSREGYDLHLQNTCLGWVIAGGAPPQSSSKNTCYMTGLEIQLTKFWLIEDISEEKARSKEEIECESYFLNTVSRRDDGRYVVRLPFIKTDKRLGNSRTTALKRLLSLERKLNMNTSLRIEYERIFEEYLRLGHMSMIEEPDDDGYYMPHHAVTKESSETTKVRIVFDASAKSNSGVSLNDVLMTGPTIQDKLFSHLIRFRTYNYVISADIEKMYRQILLHEDDRRYQQILWRKDGTIRTFQLNVLTFGVSSSPFLAIRVIKRLVEDERQNYPVTADIIGSHLYVDDLLTGAETIDEARKIRDEVTELLAHGGFVIRQWASNDERIINDLETNALHVSFTLNADRALKTLGLIWNTQDDEICYATNPIKRFERVTKRNILSEIAKIFDPIGLLGPVILYAKKLIQNVWRCGIQWDEPVPQTICNEWLEFSRQWEIMDQMSFPRKLSTTNHSDIQIHGFCDAGNVGYGACLYVRSSGDQGYASSRLLCAKSRVAPLKPVTIPRLELCGALLLARLYREIVNPLNCTPSKIIFWCDSTITLHWLKTEPHRLKTFVANRVIEIRDLTEAIEWRHIRSHDNPADALSRGQLPLVFVQNQSWRSGPSWLIKNEDDWLNEIIQICNIPELKKNTCMVSVSDDLGILGRFSSYAKLCRVVAYCRRCRPTNKHKGSLCTQEIIEAEVQILRLLQKIHFHNDIEDLKTKNHVRKGKILNLNPFLDENGIIRVGGRLQRSKLTFAQKHPILLPNRNHLTDVIIRETHESNHHSGIQHTLAAVRQRFWVLDGRNQVRRIVRKCMRCFRFDSNTVEPKMGNLPIARVREAIPFFNTGVDFCGPFYIKERKFRNRTRIKVYVCIFVCMSIKAVHLEVVTDLSSDGFLAALRRFAARRGFPEHIYSDNGTNFVGANNQLKEMYVLLNSEAHKERINKFASDHRITWHFIPPAAPHFGGLWESTVKLFKHHFRRVIGDSLFTHEELNTFTAEVEGILNSRPIIPLSSNPNDTSALTPAHYFIGKPLTALPEGNLTCVPANRLSTWQHITKMRQDFWARWYLEYLNELQVRHKWSKDGPQLNIGTMILIKDKRIPCTQWVLGRITRLYPGDDGVIRTASIMTSSGEMTRPVRGLCPLPMEL